MGPQTLRTLDDAHEEIRDLSDFCEAWPALRGQVRAFVERRCPDDPQMRAALIWLCLLADRVYYQPPDPM